MRTHEFSLSDAEGMSHRYACTLHPPSEGQRIVLALLGHAAKPMARLAKGVLSGGGGFRELFAGLKDPDKREVLLGQLLDRLDLDELGADISAVLLRPDAADLVRTILAKTARDGKPLSVMTAYDEAYVANYGELAAAVAEVIKVNRFFSVLPTSSRGPKK